MKIQIKLQLILNVILVVATIYSISNINHLYNRISELESINTTPYNQINR